MKLWQKFILGLVIILALFAGWVFYPQGVWPFVVSYPELETLGEQYDVEILRDSYGVPHVFGQTDADAAFGLGYAHAEDDFLTIQQALVAARGQLGKAYGIDAAPNDYMVQLVRIWDVVEAEYDTIPPDVQAVMTGYADGVNYYAAQNTDDVLLPELFPVTGKDVAAGFIHRVPLFFGLDGVRGDLFAEERQQPVSEKAVTELPPMVRYGSNVIAVSPNRSANGETFFAINSHQPWEGIVAWYEAHIHSEEGWNAVGGLLPGSPTIFDEWQTAVRQGPLPMFNIGYADETGNIYYLYNGLIPQRTEGYNWEQYLPGDTLWTDYVLFEQLPQLLNPESGFVQNSNMLVQWDAQGNLTSESIHQYGSATLDETSPHYADQAPIFVARQLTPVWFTEAEIQANLSEAYRP